MNDANDDLNGFKKLKNEDPSFIEIDSGKRNI